MTKYVNLRNMIMIFTIVIGIVLMIVGIIQGELTAVMRKAVIICFECIGIG